MDTTPGSDPQPRSLFNLSRPMQILLGGTGLGVLLLLVSLVVLFRSLDVFLGGLDEWRKHWYVLGGVLLAQIAGLGVLFATLQLLRAEERERPLLRRLVYGYNAVLTGLLLLEVLVVLNFLAYVPTPPFKWLNTTYDWTENRLYTLDRKSREFLATKLDKKITLKVLLPSATETRDPNLQGIVEELNSLTDQMQSASNNKVVVDKLSPDHMRQTIKDLTEKYKLPERMGVLIIYGTEPDESTEFITYQELSAPEPGNPERVVFNGEQLLMSRLAFLARGKKKPVIYFTQGNGELELSGMAHFGGSDEGMGILRQRLEKGDYVVKELRFNLDTDKVPDDADVVVVAGPTRRFPPHGINALNEYMGLTEPRSTPGEETAKEGDKKTPRKGKMIVLFDVVPTQQTMAVSLEDFVRQFGVEVDADRLISLDRDAPTQVIVTGVQGAEVPVAQYLREQRMGIPFDDVRTVRTGTSTQTSLVPRPMLEVLAVGREVIRETNLAAEPREVAIQLGKRENAADRRTRVLTTNPLMAVSVEEPTAPEGADRTKPPAKLPRMVVMGDATWLSNREQAAPAGRLKLGIFAECLSWLGEHPDISLDLDPKDRKTFRLKNPDVFWKLASLPMAVLTLGIVGLGLGVWVARRR